MTLVYEPPFDPAFGAEFARVNLDASLKQRQAQRRKDGQPRFADQIAMLGLPKTANLPLPERALINHGLKWWPTKKYQVTLTERGERVDWRVEVASLTHAEARRTFFACPHYRGPGREEANLPDLPALPASSRYSRGRHPRHASHTAASVARLFRCRAGAALGHYVAGVQPIRCHARQSAQPCSVAVTETVLQVPSNQP